MQRLLFVREEEEEEKVQQTRDASLVQSTLSVDVRDAATGEKSKRK